MGFIEFDGVRYWDCREIQPFEMHVEKSPLESDSGSRTDLKLLKQGDIKRA